VACLLRHALHRCHDRGWSRASAGVVACLLRHALHRCHDRGWSRASAGVVACLLRHARHRCHDWVTRGATVLDRPCGGPTRALNASATPAQPVIDVVRGAAATAHREAPADCVAASGRGSSLGRRRLAAGLSLSRRTCPAEAEAEAVAAVAEAVAAEAAVSRSASSATRLRADPRGRRLPSRAACRDRRQTRPGASARRPRARSS
jgi:hypothetical protein